MRTSAKVAILVLTCSTSMLASAADLAHLQAVYRKELADIRSEAVQRQGELLKEYDLLL